MTFTLRYYQQEAVRALFDYWSQHRGNPLIALPTASGKSVVIAAFCHQALQYYPSTRIMILTHVKELIEQNLNKLRAVWPSAPAGVYSAGLGRKDATRSITFGGIQSVGNAVELFGHIDVVLIDECHLVSPDEETRYRQVISRLKERNPRLKVGGFTATWWRNKHGALTNSGGLFTDVAYNRTTPDDFQRFIAEGYLAPLIARSTKTKLDVSEVGVTAGEFNLKQLEQAVDNDTTTHAALREVCANAADRRAWVMFCSGIEHAEHVAAILNQWGIRTGVVHSRLSSSERDNTLRAWYSGSLRCVTNNNVLTTGIDYPALDLIGMLRPTMSSSLWVQMLGRGMRVAPGKTNCLVLDFAGNTVRLGPVDDPVIPGQPRPGAPGDAPVRICEHCGAYSHASARFCEACGADFPVREKISDTASSAPLMTQDFPIIETFPVNNVAYSDWVSKKDNRSIRVTYYSGIRSFHEYVSLEGVGLTKHKAHSWWKQRHFDEPPATIDDALQKVSELRVPTAIRVWVNRQYPEIVSHEWDRR